MTDLSGKFGVVVGVANKRSIAWAIAQALSWALGDDELLTEHVDCARWLLDA